MAATDWRKAMTTTQEAVIRPSSLTNTVTGIFALLGLIDIALTGAIGSSDVPSLIASLGLAALGFITLGCLIPARRGSRPALIAIIVTRLISAALAVPGFFLNAFFWSGPVWVVITEAFVVVATITALVLLRQPGSRFA
jgi:hypothetical protein